MNDEAIARVNAIKMLNREIENLDTDDIKNIIKLIIENDKTRENAYFEKYVGS